MKLSIEHISFTFLTTAPCTNSIIQNFLEHFLRVYTENDLITYKNFSITQ